MNNSGTLEGIYGRELAQKVQALSLEEKAELDWSTRQYLSLDERTSLCKESVVEWGIHKFTCKPFTIGLFKDLYGIISPAFFGQTSESEVFAKTAAIILQGKTDGAEAFLRRGFVTDVLEVDGSDAEKYHKADAVMGAVSFFSIHYWRFGEKLTAKTPQVVEVTKKNKKSPKQAK